MSEKAEIRYGFGKNWTEYLAETQETLNVRLDLAKNHLKESFNVEHFKDKKFCDIGCGSGLFSYSALKLGAKEVVSIDFDQNSVDATTSLKTQFSVQNSNWSINRGSILEIGKIDSLKKFDFVYCAGVAHHTGNMWSALSNLADLVQPDGKLFVSIYNRVIVFSKFWRLIKVLCNRSRIFEILFRYFYISLWCIYWLATFRNPIKCIKEYGLSDRGMSFMHDIKDWIGGYPYEFATTGEIISFYISRGFALEKVEDVADWGLNTMIFRKLKS